MLNSAETTEAVDDDARSQDSFRSAKSNLDSSDFQSLSAVEELSREQIACDLSTFGTERANIEYLRRSKRITKRQKQNKETETRYERFAHTSQSLQLEDTTHAEIPSNIEDVSADTSSSSHTIQNDEEEILLNERLRRESLEVIIPESPILSDLDDSISSISSDLGLSRSESPDVLQSGSIAVTNNRPMTSLLDRLDSVIESATNSENPRKRNRHVSSDVLEMPDMFRQILSQSQMLNQLDKSYRLAEDLTKSDFINSVGESSVALMQNALGEDRASFTQCIGEYEITSDCKDKSFHYFQKEDIKSKPFPVVNEPWMAKVFAEESIRVTMFKSGFVLSAIEHGKKIPRSVLRWLLNETALETDVGLVSSYFKVLKECVKALPIDEGSILRVMSYLGVKEKYLDIDAVLDMSYSNGGEGFHPRFGSYNVYYIVEIFNEYILKARCSLRESRLLGTFACRVILDAESNMSLRASASRLLSSNLSIISDKDWHSETRHFILSVFESVKDSNLRLRLLQHFPVQSGYQCMHMRTSLALAFFLDNANLALQHSKDDRLPIAKLILPELSNNPLYSLRVPRGEDIEYSSSSCVDKNHELDDRMKFERVNESCNKELKNDESVAGHRSNSNRKFDYVLLRHRIQYLDYVLTTQLKLDIDRTKIQYIIEILRSLYRRIFDPFARYPDRTDAKDRIQSLEFRLSYMII
ncbi:hypothetical protein V1511DRAFT_512044 [Dipodascopsis uninucleata]